MDSSKNEIIGIADVICTTDEPGRLLDAVQRYAKHCAAIVGEVGARATQLPTGVAISPVDAARCSLDLMRTARFVRGIVEALQEASQRVGSRPLRILYAGCGPYAPLAILPLLRAADVEQRWMMVDIHRSSARAVSQLIQSWQLQGSIAGVSVADATCLRVGPPDFDLIIAEVMQRSLAKEPQIAVMAALAPGLANGGVMIPQAVELRLALADLEREFTAVEANGEAATVRPRLRHDLGRVLRVDAQSAREFRGPPDTSEVELGEIRVSVADPKGLAPLLRTLVEVHGDQRLGDYDSGLTVPEMLGGLGELRDGDRLRAVLRTGPSPGVELRRIGLEA